MTNITLFHAAPSRSSIVRWMLEELGPALQRATALDQALMAG